MKELECPYCKTMNDEPDECNFEDETYFCTCEECKEYVREMKRKSRARLKNGNQYNSRTRGLGPRGGGA